MKKSFPRVHGKSRKEVQELETKKTKYLSYCSKIGWSASQLNAIEWALEHNIKVSDIELYVDMSYNADQMYCVFQGIANGLSDDKIELFNSTIFNQEQMFAILEVFKIDSDEKNAIEVDIEKVRLIANPCYSAEQMRCLFGFMTNGTTMDFIEAISHPEICADSMYDLYRKYNGKNIEKIKELATLMILEN